MHITMFNIHIIIVQIHTYYLLLYFATYIFYAAFD